MSNEELEMLIPAILMMFVFIVAIMTTLNINTALLWSVAFASVYFVIRGLVKVMEGLF